MNLATQSLFRLEDTFVRELEGLYLPWRAAEAPEPRLLALNEELARELGLEPSALRTPEGIAALTGGLVPEGATPVAQAYAGHQFGGYSPRLGDGRALLLGEVIDVHGRRRDLHLKGSGRTPFARGGDGKAAVGPMLREYLIGEAMHGLGIRTTRALAVVATGEQVVRETMLPGAVLARIAASHIRVGTFQFAASGEDQGLARRLADYSIARHHPAAADDASPYLALLDAVIEAQASLIASWMNVGFIHGVMNTDNMTISGETIDYGPCAFMDAYDPATVFSSIDHGGRYAYGNQPPAGQWNLARFAETLLGLIDPEPERAIAAATELLNEFPERYEAHRRRGMLGKLGLSEALPDDAALIDDLLALLHAQNIDFTSFFRALGPAAAGDLGPARALFLEPAAFEAWAERWRRRLGKEGTDGPAAAERCGRANPIYIPRNHLVEEALEAATAGDLGPCECLLEAISRPFEERPGLERYAEPSPEGSAAYRTYCGT